MKLSCALAAAALFFAMPADACSLRNWEPNDLVENTPVSSPNGRFTAVVRWWPDIPDFTSERAGKVMHLDDPAKYDFEGNEVFEPAPRPELVTAALYDSQRALIHEFSIRQDSFSDVLVPDSGEYLVAYRSFSDGECSSYAEKSDPFITIFNADGSVAATLKVGDVFTSSDVYEMRSTGRHVDFSLHGESGGRDVVLLEIDGAERRIDLATGVLLDPKTDLLPGPRVWATALEVWSEKVPVCADCDAQAVQLDSGQFFRRATEQPIPEFPVVAMKARVRGKVYLLAQVSEDGRVLSVKHSALPFGIDVAADAAVRQWRFRPLLIGGKAVKFSGVVVMHFEDVDEVAWEAMKR